MKRKIYDNLGQRCADRIAAWGGSWSFLFWFTAFQITYISFNVYCAYAFDRFPFIFLNLGLSMFSCYQAPIILMAQNRQAEIDRRNADLDLKTDLETKEMVQKIFNHLGLS